jgi:protein-disulfide isomerase
MPEVSERDHIIGRPNAPVTMVQYGDFECPYSGKAFVSVRRLRETLPNELRFAYRHYPILPKHKYAQQAAEASEAAAVQGKFWEFHDILYDHQGELGGQDLLRYATQLKLDVHRFEQDLNARTFKRRVQEDQQSGNDSGVMGTPTFFINGSIYEGYYEYRELYDAIDIELQK